MLLEQETDIKIPPAGAGEGRLRRCIATRKSLPSERLIRFVVGPDGVVAPDVAGKLPGRGLWLCAERDIVRRACADNLFAKAARCSALVPGDLAQRVEDLLVSRSLGLIGLARRAGDAVAGFEKVRAMLSGGRGGVVLSASDGADGGRAKLGAVQPDVARVDVLTSTELGGVFGREMIVHAAVAKGKLADKLVAEAARLAGFRSSHQPGKFC